jgi:DNA-binding transcriptional regulator/RsmH inhibitor MraZ
MENEELFFCGDFRHALDSQFRVTLPSAWRCGEGEPHLVLFPGRDRDLLLFPYVMFREFLIRARSSALANPAAQAALAQIGRVVRDIRPDKQGRIKLEKEMLQAIGVESQLVMVGAITHIKLAAPQNWEPVELGDASIFLDQVQKLNEGDNDGLSDLLAKLIGKGK